MCAPRLGAWAPGRLGVCSRSTARRPVVLCDGPSRELLAAGLVAPGARFRAARPAACGGHRRGRRPRGARGGAGTSWFVRGAGREASRLAGRRPTVALYGLGSGEECDKEQDADNSVMAASR
jgi:hypothetical protein